MSNASSRRSFLKSAAAAPLAAAFAPSMTSSLSAASPGSAGLLDAAQPIGAPAYSGGTPKKSMLISLVQPKELPIADKFKVARDAGFVAMEMHTVEDQAEAEAAKKASEETGVKIHSVMNAAHWRSPLSSSDPEVVNKSVAGMETSLKNAALWGAGAVLLVPAVVDAKTSYQDAWKRSQQVIRERLLPKYQEQKVIIAIEEVWNKFLLSPLEMARYVDEFKSDYVKAYMDVGNVVFYGFPQDWIRTLGKRIVRMHLKDFKLDRGAGKFEWKNLGEGDIDWVDVRKAMTEIGYDGYMTIEIAGGDATYHKDVSARIDRFLAGGKPVA
jgi:L-ribulose-5-phosphate 3-epimerase